MSTTRSTVIAIAIAAAAGFGLVGCGTDKYADDPAFTRIARSSSCSQLQTYLDMADSGRDAASFGSSAKARFADMSTRAMDRMDSVHCVPYAR